MPEAWCVKRFADPVGALELREMESERLSESDVRIAAVASGLNALDLGMCRGVHPLRPEPPFVLGAEVFGEVTEVGAAVSRFQVGDRVVAMRPSAYGTFRREVVVPEFAAHAVPRAVPDTDAAALLVDFQAAHTALVRRARLEPGEWVFVNAAAGALGSAVVQVARAHEGRVAAAAASEEKRQVCLELGAEVAVDTHDPALAARVKEATDGHGVDVVCDLVGGESFAAMLEAVAMEGRLITMGWVGGSMPELDPMELIVRNLALLGVSWGSSYPREMWAVVRETHAHILALYEEGGLRPLVGRLVTHRELPQALEAIGARATVGKSVMVW